MNIDIYDHQKIEARWRNHWAETNLYRTPRAETQPGSTFYCLDFFPYPSGDGLSVGHGRNYIPADVISRYRRMKGDMVLHPMGWDAFGLPAENEAVKRGVHPRETTTRYAANYRRQFTLMGCSYDWEREINSSQPEFYRWTQWFFLLLHKRGLAYQATGQQWWCPDCKTVLANEQVESGGICWRCSSQVYQRGMKQWYFRITTYADELLADLAELDWPEHILTMQRNWIGRSAGVEFEMAVADTEHAFRVYTTRPDTVYGLTFAVLAPEHPLVEHITTSAQRAVVTAYCEAATQRSELDRLQGERNRDGVFTGAYAINPVNGRQVPIYVADYVLLSYGSGAIMAVPAHDGRDFDFATRYNIPIEVVISPPDWTGEPLATAYTEPGVLVNSGPWDGHFSTEAIERITDWMTAEGLGQRRVQYRMRDWLISRQRYWGAPIPIIHCQACGPVPVPEADLPVILPHIERWEPGDEGQSPLANVAEFVQTSCPACGGPARRETDTMDGFACSSWYALRFVSPHYQPAPFEPAALARWGTPDLYVGGAEHATLHLLYTRFWTKVMADAGVVSFREPFPRLRSQGMMHVRDPETGQTPKMSKSSGNVVTPDSVVESHGADALRIYLLFMAPFENTTIWETEGINGAGRFVQRVWRFVNRVITTNSATASTEPVTDTARSLIQARHRFVKRITEDVEAFKFNTAVATMMAYLNTLTAYHQDQGVTADLVEATHTFILLLAPFAPYVTEELWARWDGEGSVHQQSWPAWDEALAVEETTTLIVQVNGRVRERLTVPVTITEAEAQTLAKQSETVRQYLNGQEVTRVIYVPGRLVNVVAKPMA